MKLSSFLWLLLIPAALFAKNVVTVDLSNDFGTQLFQVAGVTAIAKKERYDAQFPGLCKNSYFRKCNTKPISKRIHKMWCHPKETFMRVRLKGNTRIKSPLFSWKYFDRQFLVIRDLYSQEDFKNPYEDLYNTSTVAVYVHTKPLDGGVRKFIHWDYYKKALQLIPRECRVLVFSDDLDLTKRRLFNLRDDIHFIKASEEECVTLMSLADHQIISNSALSWWGAFLNKNPNKIVVAPRSWNKGEFVDYLDDLYLPGWVQIAVNDE